MLRADDLNLFHKISSLKGSFELWANINIVYDWAIQNSILINQNKINVVKYTRKKSFISFNYFLNKLLKKDLVAFFDHKLTFDIHVSYLKKKW